MSERWIVNECLDSLLIDQVDPIGQWVMRYPSLVGANSRYFEVWHDIAVMSQRGFSRPIVAFHAEQFARLLATSGTAHTGFAAVAVDVGYLARLVLVLVELPGATAGAGADDLSLGLFFGLFSSCHISPRIS